MSNFATAVRRVKLPPPRLGPNAAVSSERVVLERVSTTTSPVIVPMTLPPVAPSPVTTVTPPFVPPIAAAVPQRVFPSTRDLDVTDLGVIELEVVRLLSGRSLSVGRIADNLSVLMANDEVLVVLHGLAAAGKVVGFIGEKRSQQWRLVGAAKRVSTAA